ncbi:MAG: glycoside hydrolase family 57 protein [Phycisphaerae bacterium]
MASVCFYFQVHQPWRLRRYSVFDTTHDYFDANANREICRKVAHKCYLPANQTLLELVRLHEGRFRIAYSLTGTVIDQFRAYAPEVLDSFHRLNESRCVEFLDETYYHSLSFLYSRQEFTDQVRLHRQLMSDLFGQQPRVFRNTELIYSNDVAHVVAQLGYAGICAEGADAILGWRSPTFLYRPPACPQIVTLLKHYRLSDDIAFRFSNRAWAEWPLTAEKFSRWVDQVNGNGHVVNLFMDYETFGEHQWAETGIFDFLKHMPREVLRHPDNDFATPSQVVERYPVADEFDSPNMISWADTERDLSAWLGNAMQANALHELYRLESAVKASGDEALLSDWRKLTTSDHFYYMCTKYFADGDVHKYFNPYDSPYDSYINFMNVLDNVRARARATEPVAR